MMTAMLLGTAVALAAAMFCWITVSIVVTAVWPWQRERLTKQTPGVRALALAILRLLPAGVSAIAFPLVLISFLRFEPADTSEISGVSLRLLAIVGLVSISMGIARAARAWRATIQVVGRWPTLQRIVQGRLPIVTVDAAFPVVAVVGIVKPRLYIARAVLSSCDRRELDAMIAHEAAHVAARDNLTRLLFLCAPMFPGSATAQVLEREWTAASEEAADDLARGDVRASLALASALTKVSRLAAGQQPPLVHASAISSGGAIEHRVRRLLEPTPSDVAARGRFVFAAAFVFVAACAASLTLDRQIYEAAEFCIRHLP